MAEAAGASSLSLVSSDGRTFDVPSDVIARRGDGVCAGYHSATVNDLLLDDLIIGEGGRGLSIPLSNVTGETFEKVLEFCRRRHGLEARAPASSVVTDEEWDRRYLQIDQAALFELVSAADYLDIKDLLDVTCMQVARLIRGKTAEELRTLFNIKNDFTPEEETEIRTENAWLFD
jgi:S-phase kinase-associated protein 1